MVFDQGSNGTSAGVLSGNGVTTKIGGGSRTLTADSSGFAGTTNVLAGKLVLDGLLGGLVIVAGGGRGGSGTLGALSVASGVSLVPETPLGR